MTETQLRRWHRSHSFSRAGIRIAMLGMARGGLTYWVAPTASDRSAAVQHFDRPGECEAAALAVHDAYGWPVVFGWAAAVENGRQAAWGHCWNLDPDTDQPIDAARDRIGPTGYLGIELQAQDLGMIAAAV